MRIVAGSHRGRTLVAPKGHSTRPTADRTRQALFNVLEHAAWSPGLEDAQVIDLFAGSGALGLEAVSRGAASCLFIDSDPAAISAITENIAALRVEDRCTVRRSAGDRLGTRAPARKPFDLVFLDPPYARGLTEPALEALRLGDWLAPDAVIVAERGAGEAALTAAGYSLLDSRDWGAARIWFLRAAPGA